MTPPKKKPRKKKAKKTPTIRQIVNQQHREMVDLITDARKLGPFAFDPSIDLDASHLPYHADEWVGPLEE